MGGGGGGGGGAQGAPRNGTSTCRSLININHTNREDLTPLQTHWYKNFLVRNFKGAGYSLIIHEVLVAMVFSCRRAR